MILLSLHSPIIGSLKSNAQVLLYVKPEDAQAARKKKAELPAAVDPVQMKLEIKQTSPNGTVKP